MLIVMKMKTERLYNPLDFKNVNSPARTEQQAPETLVSRTQDVVRLTKTFQRFSLGIHTVNFLPVRHILPRRQENISCQRWDISEFSKGYMIIHKIRCSINNHWSIWIRILFLLFWGQVRENKLYPWSSWVDVCKKRTPQVLLDQSQVHGPGGG